MNNLGNAGGGNGGSGNSGNPEGIERGSCLLRYASQNSLDESSQKHIQRPNGKDRQTGQYQNDQHTRRAFESMNDMRKQSQLCDVTLVADDIEIPAHKMVLASCSPYFYAMFTGFEESRQERITLQGVDHRALELLIEYVYTSTVEVNEENVQVLLTAANLLQLTDVREACCDYLQTQLDASNCLGIREFADMHACVDLLGYAETYIEQHFNEVIQFDEFLNLSHEQVINLICNDRISVPCEEKVYECVISWIRYDPTMREQYTAALMENVRLPFLSKEYLTQRVDKEPLLEGNIKCKDLIIEALTYHLLPNDTKSIRTIPRKAVGLPKILLVIGGQAPKAIRSVECYDLREEKWYQAAEMPNRRCRAGLCVLGDKVYAVGGFNGSLRVRTVDVYDPATNQWSDFYNMEARRSTLGVAVLNGCIYAVGGFDGTTGLSSAEMYDPKLEAWRFISSMSTRRSSVGVGVVNGVLYAVGGYDGFSRQCLSSVERYNPETDTWSPVADMSARRSGAGVGVLNNILYAVGGHDGPMVRRSVEAYDPETNQWRSVADMAFCRRNAGVVAHCGMLYVVGGDDGTSNLASVEVYSPESDTWRPLPASMTIGRSYAGVCMIDKPIQTASNANGVVDDENSQAEGTVEGAVGYARPESNSANNNNNNNANHPHYENLYESIERYNSNNNSNQNNNNAAVPVANAPADEHHQQPAQAQPQPQPLQSHSDAPARPPNAPLNQANLANNNGNQSNNLNGTSQPRVSYRNDLYDRAQQHPGPAYDVPRSVRAGLGIRRNFHIDLGSSPPSASSMNRSAFHSGRYGSSSVAPASYSTGGSAGGSLLYGSNRQRSLDDTVEAANFYANLNYHQPSSANLPLRYENLYEQIRDEPIYRNTGPGAQVYGRLNVIGHGIGRIERHLSSSCGNIDHYNLGGHYAVLGHSHYGTVGHIRLNAAASGPAGVVASAGTNCAGVSAAASGPTAVGQKDPNNVKTSASSFFSCLHGENSQSMTNIPRGSSMAPPSGTNGSSLAKERETRSSSAGPSPAAAATAALLATGSFTSSPAPNEATASSSSSSANTAKQTGAIPKTKMPSSSKNGNGSSPNGPTATGSMLPEKSTLSLRNALTKTKAFTGSQSDDEKAGKATTTSPPPDQANGGTLNRISKSSLQWLLMNKWLPLWIGQGPDCKVIDFNFMFSRDCVGCDAASAASQMYGSPRLGCMPLAQDVVRFNARAEMHREADRRRDLNGRPMHSTLCRLRETQQAASNRREPPAGRQLYEDPSYENVHVQWQNGFEFCRSRESDYNYAQQQQGPAPQQQRPQLQRARSESPKFNTAQQRRATMGSSRKYSDPFRKYELNSENNTFKPKLVRMESTESSGSGAAGEFAKGEKSAVASPPLEVDELELEAEGAVGGRDLAAAASPGPSVQRTPSAAECDSVVLGQAAAAAALPPATDNETEQQIAANNNEQTED